MSNEAFEKWLKENYLVDMSEFIVDEQERTYIKENNILRKAWQAAKADSESILQEQQNTIAELEIDYNMLFSDFLELQAKNSELSASINDLREALEENHYCNSSDKAINLYNAAISKTPAQHINDDVLIFTKDSLQEHDNEVIEKCAKVVDESYAFDSDGFSKEIRALKT